MNTMPDLEVFVTLGVDTHKDVHVAVALDQLGRWLGVIEIATTAAGYGQLLAWASAFGTIDKVGIEGTGSHGAGLARWLTARGLIVIEVDRPDRRTRRNKGKSAASAPTPPRHCWSPRAITPSGSPTKHRSPRWPAPRRWKHPRARGNGIG